MRQLLPLFLLGAILSSTAALAQDEKPTETDLAKQIRADFTAKKYEEAESALNDFETRFPKSTQLTPLLYQGYLAHARNRDYERAAPFITAVVDAVRESRRRESSGFCFAGELHKYSGGDSATSGQSGRSGKEA